LQQAAIELSLDSPVLADDAVTLLMQHRWDGNVRELKNVMQRLTILTPGISIGKNDVALAIGSMGRGEPQPGDALEQAVVACIRDYINHLGHAEVTQLHAHLIHHIEPPLLRLALKECNGHQLNTAAMLGLNRNTLRKLLRQYDIDAADYHL